MASLGNTFLFQNKLGDKVNEMLESDSIFRIYCDDFELKFKCMDCNFTKATEIPSHPLDNNSQISDNVIFGNLQFNCNLIVDYEDINEFWEALNVGNLSNNGFTIETISQYEPNMFWNNANYSETSDSTGSVFLSLNFLKVKFVESKTGFLEYKKLPQPKDASKQGGGKVSSNVKTFEGKKLNNAVDKSMLARAWDKVATLF